MLLTRNSNALDFALLIQDLVPLLEAYEQACRAGDSPKRLDLADVICQGVSPDPELFLNRLELLGAYSMIEHLFVTIDGNGDAAYTPMGQRHVQLLQEYNALIARVSTALSDDCLRFRPAAGTYSPYGALYGFASDLLEHMALKTLQPGALTRFSLEDVFTGGDGGTDKLAWVSGWRQLPHLTPEVRKQFEYPQQFADEMFDRLAQALRRRTADDAVKASARTGRVFVMTADERQQESNAPAIPELPVRYIRSSDRQMVAAQRAHPDHEVHLLTERREGKSLLSYRTSGGWVAITKDILTDVLAAGRDVRVTGLPAAAAAVLTLMCPTLVVTDREIGSSTGETVPG